MARRVLAVLVLLGVAIGLAAGSVPSASARGPVAVEADTGAVEVVLFHSATCPHCAAELAWLDDHLADRADVALRTYEITGSAENRARLAATAADLGFQPRAVPVTIVGGAHVFIGFNDEVAVQIAYTIDQLARGVTVDPDRVTERGATTDLAVPLLGTIDVGDRSLVVATLLIGLLDGVNPCSLWALSLLLALVIHTRSRRRVMLVGTVFLSVTTALYGMYMLGAYSILQYIAYVGWIRVGIAVVAGAMGTVNLLDGLGVDVGVTLRIPDAKKPQLIRRMRHVARADVGLPATVGATAALAVGVSLIETPCTAGFPIMWGNLLASRGVGGAGAAALFALYMAVFLVDEFVVFFLAVATMRAARLQAEEGRLLKLAGGVVMLTLAAVMIVAPTLLESLAGTFAVFGSAAVGVVLLWAVVRRLGAAERRRLAAAERRRGSG